MTTYEEFLTGKVRFDRAYGHPCTEEDVNPILLPHQRAVVAWAVRGGRRALFEKFGLGKTVQQLEVLRLTLAASGGRGLIVCPLGVRQEFAHDAQMLGMEVPRFVRRNEELTGDGLYITNYESVRDGKLDPSGFTVVSLDEASVLRSFGSKTFQTFLTLFDSVPHRFVATATPSPNRFKELIHYAGFLGVMDTGQALTRFFQRDSTQANNLTLYPHKEREFWLWLNTWAVFLQRPSDLGFDDTGYDLPDLTTTWHQVEMETEVAVDRDGQVQMYRSRKMSTVDASREKRRTIDARVEKLRAIVREHAARDDGQIILWCHLNDEQAAIEKVLADEGLAYSSVHGSNDVDENERRLAEWKRCETYALIGKPMMLGQGMNLQQCNTAVFVGIDDKFNDFIQACHRIQRFGQTRECFVHAIYAETETEIRGRLLTKWAQHEELTDNMTDVIREHGLDTAGIVAALERSMGVERVEVAGEGWTSVHNDTVDETA
ncbi:MAG: helicase-related protein, partial [Nocardioides sp.]|uniref:helicase-related protein n=1 Tax=Nocardioides sp. TaxID=35761 RepID=UPI003F123EF8